MGEERKRSRFPLEPRSNLEVCLLLDGWQSQGRRDSLNEKGFSNLMKGSQEIPTTVAEPYLGFDNDRTLA
jgi:hypothetical protein